MNWPERFVSSFRRQDCVTDLKTRAAGLLCLSFYDGIYQRLANQTVELFVPLLFLSPAGISQLHFAESYLRCFALTVEKMAAASLPWQRLDFKHRAAINIAICQHLIRQDYRRESVLCVASPEGRRIIATRKVTLASRKFS